MRRYEKTIKEDDRYILTRVRDREGFYNVWLLEKTGAIRDYSGRLESKAKAKLAEKKLIRRYFIG